ncbi:leucine-rich repeat-containing protein 74B-like [Galleria mellonella]|uniref:Leucine-rich repeat-containing protein 74B-like n=1 Tax=Galleria mellonella TaxID=7137 RepID=A0A6J3C971_GALME|nr:leucine-rich repeat-containing protein 74B-like [Galleria mellonella]
MSSSSSSKYTQIQQDKIIEEKSSDSDPPMSEWSSLVIELSAENKKKSLAARGLYSPGSGEICSKYISMSDSDISRHVYYNYPAVLDPGINEALSLPNKPVIYPDNGQELYLATCKEMNVCPVRLFIKSLLLQEINLSYYGVTPPGVRAMSMALQYNKHVQRLNLTDNFLNDDACYHLGSMLTTNATIKELILAGCRIGASGVLRLIDTLSINRNLTTLDLSRNCLGEEGGLHFAVQISQGATISRVNLSNNQLGKQTALAFADALEFRNTLTHIDLSWNNFFHSPSTVKMLDVLSNSEVLKEINLSWNSMEGEKIAGAVANLFLIPTLTLLDLSNNRFRGESIPLMISNIIKAKKLLIFDLSFNPLSPDDALVVLQQMLKPRVKIENLYLENICVDKNFMICLDRVKKMKSRKNFIIKHGHVIQNWTVYGQDSREVILNRAKFLGMRDKKRRVDIALFFLRLTKEYPKAITVKDLIDKVDAENVPLDGDLIAELANVFPGPKSAKAKYINLVNICEYINRIWPDKVLPPTPPPELEPMPEPPKRKLKGKKGKP